MYGYFVGIFVGKSPFIENTIFAIKSGYMATRRSLSGPNMAYAIQHSEPTPSAAPGVTLHCRWCPSNTHQRQPGQKCYCARAPGAARCPIAARDATSIAPGRLAQHRSSRFAPQSPRLPALTLTQACPSDCPIARSARGGA